MRKVSLLLVVMVLLLINVLPTYAQEEQPTIFGVFKARAESDTPEFTMLVKAIENAAPPVLARLNDPEITAGTFTTIFAPTDAAFEAYFADMEIDQEEFFANTDALTAMIAFQCLAGIFTADNFKANLDAVWGTFLPHTFVRFSEEEETLKINDVAIIEADVPAFNAMIHVVDGMLMPPEELRQMEPPEKSIYDILSEREDFSLFKYAMDTMGFQLDLQITPYTLFIPTDDVIQALLDQFGITMDEFLENSDTSTPILFYHFLSGAWDTVDFAELQGEESGVVAGTQQPGTFMTVTADGETLTVDAAKVVEADIFASNGVIHVIDSVLLPSGS